MPSSIALAPMPYASICSIAPLCMRKTSLFQRGEWNSCCAKRSSLYGTPLSFFRPMRAFTIGHPEQRASHLPQADIDRWILSLIERLGKEVTEGMDGYHTQPSCGAFCRIHRSADQLVYPPLPRAILVRRGNSRPR